MIKNLRKRFIVVAMCSMFSVLATIMVIFNVINYFHFVDDTDNKLDMIAENDGTFPQPPVPEKQPGEAPPSGKKGEPEVPSAHHGPPGERKKMSLEAPYQTRYFSVRLDTGGKVVSSNLENIAAVSEREAAQYAKEVYTKQTDRGFKEIYRYKKVSSADGIMVIFLDNNLELETFQTNLRTSLMVSAAGLFAVFVLVVLFSHLVFRPVSESYKKQKQFITDASHEIKTPLTIIDANIEVIEMEQGESDWTQSVRKQIHRLSELTRQMITLTTLDEEGFHGQRDDFLLTDAVMEGIQSFEAAAKMDGKQIQTEIESEIIFCGDETMIRQMIGILLDNAIRYSLPDSTIEVSLTQKGKRILLVIYNETQTIPKGDLALLFERFYRLDDSRNSETGGSGIGLSVAQAVVHAHHGRIRAGSDDGRSIQIRVELWRH